MRLAHGVTRPRFDILTVAATRRYTPSSLGPYAFGQVVNMSTSSQKPSALTFDLKARCSVRKRKSYPPSLRVCRARADSVLLLDIQGPGLDPPTAPWPRRVAHVYARRDAGVPEGSDTGTTRRDGMQALPEQHVPLGLKTGTGRAGHDRRRSQVTRVELQYLD